MFHLCFVLDGSETLVKESLALRSYRMHPHSTKKCMCMAKQVSAIVTDRQ